jgi:hypothetical protein
MLSSHVQILHILATLMMVLRFAIVIIEKALHQSIDKQFELELGRITS